MAVAPKRTLPGLHVTDERRQSAGEALGRVCGKCLIIQDISLGRRRTGRPRPAVASGTVPTKTAAISFPSSAAAPFRFGQGFQGALLDPAVPGLYEYEYHGRLPQMTLASSRRSRTSSFAASAGVPAMIRPACRSCRDVDPRDLDPGGELRIREPQLPDRDNGNDLLLRRHDALQRLIARLVQALLGAHDRRQRERNLLGAALDFPMGGTLRPR